VTRAPRRGDVAPAEWYDVRRASSTKPATYRCPFCGERLTAMSEHALIRPLGLGENRRHAHIACVARAREAGLLPTRSEWLRTQPRRRWWPFSRG
jgi:hypothetical protein